MPTTQNDDLTSRAAALLDLADAEYFSLDSQRSTDLELALGGLASADTPSASVALPLLALGAPKRIEVARRPSLPVLVGRVWTGMNAWQVNPKTNFVLLARLRGRGDLHLVTPFYKPRRGSQEPRSGLGTPPEPFDAETVTMSVASIDLGSATEMSPGTYTITGLLANRYTNTVHVEVEGPQSTTVAPHLTPGVRPLPAGSAATDEVIDIQAKGRNTNPKLQVRHILRDPLDLHDMNTGTPLFTCHLILTRLDEAATVIPLVVPATPLQSQGSENPREHEVAFEVDLGPLLAAKDVEAGFYQVYVDLSAELRGPFPLELEDDGG